MYFLLKGQNDQQRQVGFLLASSGPRETYEKKDGIQRTDKTDISRKEADTGTVPVWNEILRSRTSVIVRTTS